MKTTVAILLLSSALALQTGCPKGSLINCMTQPDGEEESPECRERWARERRENEARQRAETAARCQQGGWLTEKDLAAGGQCAAEIHVCVDDAGNDLWAACPDGWHCSSEGSGICELSGCGRCGDHAAGLAGRQRLEDERARERAGRERIMAEQLAAARIISEREERDGTCDPERIARLEGYAAAWESHQKVQYDRVGKRVEAGALLARRYPGTEMKTRFAPRTRHQLYVWGEDLLGIDDDYPFTANLDRGATAERRYNEKLGRYYFESSLLYDSNKGPEQSYALASWGCVIYRVYETFDDRLER